MVYKCKNCGCTTQHVDDKGFCINCTKEKEYTNEDFSLMDSKIDEVFKRVDELNNLVEKSLLEMQIQEGVNEETEIIDSKRE